MAATAQNAKLPNVTVLLNCVRGTRCVALAAWIQSGVRNSGGEQGGPEAVKQWIEQKGRRE